MTRPSWHSTWSQVAAVLSFRSQCVRAQVGAVIVTIDNRIDSTGYNGPISGLELPGTCDGWCERAISGDTSTDYSRCQTIHAEINAITRANHERIQGGTIYVSSAMCVNCARVVCNSGLAHVVHRVNVSDHHRVPDEVEALIRSAGLTVTRI